MTNFKVMKKTKKNYPKIHKACGIDIFIRPVFNYVFVSKKFIKATDAYVLIHHKTDEIFTQEFCDSLPKKAILIHRLHFAEITRAGCEDHKVEKDMIKYSYRDLWNYVPFEIDGKDMNYPNTDKVFPKDIKAVKNIGIAPSVLNRAFDVLGCHIYSIKYEFYGKDKPVMLTIPMGDYPNAKCLIMPILINEQWK